MEKSYRIMIETSSICNARCKFCPNPTLIREKKVMEERIFDQIIARIKEEKITVEKFILHLNGEPLTDPRLMERIQKLKSNFPHVPVCFTTNFALGGKEITKKLIASGLDAITISINSVNSNKYTQIMGGLDFEVTKRNLEYLLAKNREAGFPILVRVSIVDTGDREEVEQFKRLFADECEIRVLHLGQWIGEEMPGGLHPNNHALARPCGDLEQQICILSNGEFALCSFDAKGSVGLNIGDTKILDGFYSEPYTSLRRAHQIGGRKGTVCENCSFSF